MHFPFLRALLACTLSCLGGCECDPASSDALPAPGGDGGPDASGDAAPGGDGGPDAAGDAGPAPRHGWIPTSTLWAASAREDPLVVWAGESGMLVYGGSNLGGGWPVMTGATYDATSDLWTPMITTGAPLLGVTPVAFWTGETTIIWGGEGVGAQYSPLENAWSAIGAWPQLSDRYGFAAVWTGSELIVWGGRRYMSGDYLLLNDGARFDPATSNWTPMTMSNAPEPRWAPSAVWTVAVATILRSTRGPRRPRSRHRWGAWARRRSGPARR